MTCLCVTKNRRQWLPKAIACYQNQTYRPRELLILADGEDVRDLLPDDDPTILLIHIEDGRTIGEKRNFGCLRARGEIICHWDDDDYSHPERLADQVARLLDSGKAVTVYSSMRFTDGHAWWRYDGGPEGAAYHAPGTSLCYFKRWWQAHPFPLVQIGEDGAFMSEAWRHDELIADAGDWMHATIHRENTSPRQLSGKQWSRLA